MDSSFSSSVCGFPSPRPSRFTKFSALPKARDTPLRLLSVDCSAVPVESPSRSSLEPVGKSIVDVEDGWLLCRSESVCQMYMVEGKVTKPETYFAIFD